MPKEVLQWRLAYREAEGDAFAKSAALLAIYCGSTPHQSTGFFPALVQRGKEGRIGTHYSEIVRQVLNQYERQLKPKSYEKKDLDEAITELLKQVAVAIKESLKPGQEVNFRGDLARVFKVICEANNIKNEFIAEVVPNEDLSLWGDVKRGVTSAASGVAKRWDKFLQGYNGAQNTTADVAPRDREQFTDRLKNL